MTREEQKQRDIAERARIHQDYLDIMKYRNREYTDDIAYKQAIRDIQEEQNKLAIASIRVFGKQKMGPDDVKIDGVMYKTTKYKIAYIKDHLTKHPCVECGNTDIRVLEFDHVRGKKNGAVTVLARSLLTLMPQLIAEMAKCDVRCRNCHVIRHRDDHARRKLRLRRKQPKK